MSTSALPNPNLDAACAGTVRVIDHWIGGKAVAGTSGRTAELFNPATGQVQAKVPLANAAELNAAIAVAEGAFPAWAAQPPLRRARVLFRFRELFEQHLNDFAAIIVRRPCGAWAGGRAVLHAHQDGDGALADGDSRGRGYDDADAG